MTPTIRNKSEVTGDERIKDNTFSVMGGYRYINTNFLNRTVNKTRRQSKLINFIIIHHTAGRLGGDLRTLSGVGLEDEFNNRIGGVGRQVSCHYLVSKSGIAYQLASDNYTTYHAGHFNINMQSIGIEIENLGNGYDRFEDEQIERVIDLCVGYVLDYNIPIKNIRGHYEVKSTKNDPASNFFKGRMDGFRKEVEKRVNKIKYGNKMDSTTQNDYNTGKYDHLPSTVTLFNNKDTDRDIKKLYEIAYSHLEELLSTKGDILLRKNQNGYGLKIFNNIEDNKVIKEQIEMDALRTYIDNKYNNNLSK